MTKLPEEDCWHGIKDPKKRKQIQDRLAQRARRKRIREVATTAQSSSATPDSRTDSDSASQPESTQSTEITVRSLRQLATPDHSPLSSAVYAIHVTPERKAAVQIPVNVYQAMYNNGMILGLTCATVVPQKSLPAPHAPPSLRPTKLQLNRVHLPWIDRLPFPSWRDNMILWEKEFNDEEFLFDCFNMDCFSIRDGGKGWEPRDWKVNRSFLDKWGWILTGSSVKEES